MLTVSTIEEVRKEVKAWKEQGLTIGLVPTMGALHEGHASLVTAAAEQCDRVVASVFVNPAQFGKGEDLASYPRDFDRDCEILENKGCHMVFHPDAAIMYPEGFGTYVVPESEAVSQLCGKSRPGHFKGVCTVVNKLFNIVTPDKAYFGQKDAQQLVVIRQMVRDLNMNIEIVGCPTVREGDGLARSSRNTYLNEEERIAAAVLYRAMKRARHEIEEQKKKGAVEFPTDTITGAITEMITAEPLAEIDYVEAVDGTTLTSKEYLQGGDLVALAVYIGETRLIDNFTV